MGETPATKVSDIVDEYVGIRKGVGRHGWIAWWYGGGVTGGGHQCPIVRNGDRHDSSDMTFNFGQTTPMAMIDQS